MIALVLKFSLSASLGLLALGITLCFIRMLIGPVLPDRVVALDLMVNSMIAATAIFSVVTHQFIYMDVVIALALIVFLSTVAFAQFIVSQSKLKKNMTAHKE